MNVEQLYEILKKAQEPKGFFSTKISRGSSISCRGC